MKKAFSMMCLALLALPVSADDVKLVVNMAGGGGKQEFVLSDIGKITFGEDGFTVSTVGGTLAPFGYGEVSNLKFAYEATGIGAAAAGDTGLKPYYRNGCLGVDGWGAGCGTARAAVYTASGMAVLSVDDWDGTPIPVDNLGGGVYIFKVNNNTIKFVKQ